MTVEKLKLILFKPTTQFIGENQNKLEVVGESEVELRHKEQCFKTSLYNGKKNFKEFVKYYGDILNESFTNEQV